jgi:hypothetical protein
MALLTALKRQAKDDPASEIIGVTLDVEQGERVKMPVLRIDDLTITGAVVTFSDVYIFRHWGMTDQPSIMLGMDVLGSVDQMIIDYRSRELHLRPRGR